MNDDDGRRDWILCLWVVGFSSVERCAGLILRAKMVHFLCWLWYFSLKKRVLSTWNICATAVLNWREMTFVDLRRESKDHGTDGEHPCQSGRNRLALKRKKKRARKFTYNRGKEYVCWKEEQSASATTAHSTNYRPLSPLTFMQSRNSSAVTLSPILMPID